jgi:hypothetical protein
VKQGTLILHSQADETIPFTESQELLRNSGLEESALIVVEHEHRLADEESLKMMLEAVEWVAGQTSHSKSGVHRFMATQVSAYEEAGAFIVGVADQEATEYFMFQRSLPGNDNEDWGIYVELNDQINSAYDTVSRCVLTRERLHVELSKPLDRAGIYKVFQIALRISDPQRNMLADGLRQVFAQKKETLTIT